MADDYTPPTGTNKPGSARPVPGGLSPVEELKKLKEALAKDQREADKLKTKLDESQAAIKELEKAVAQTSQVTTGFATAVQALSVQRLETIDFLANQLPQIEKLEEVKNNRAAIDAATKEVAAAIVAKDSERQVLEQKLNQEKTALQTANDDYTAKKEELDRLKDLPRQIQDGFTALGKIRKRIDSEGPKKPLVQYVLALELKVAWDEVKGSLTTPEELGTAFTAKAGEVRTASVSAAAQDEKYKVTLGELDAACKELEARKKGRLDEIIKRVNELPAGVPAGAGAASTAY